VHKGNEHAIGEGRVAQDQSANKAVQFWEFENPQHKHNDVYELARYDLGFDYAIDSNNKTMCYKKAVTGSLPGWFDWVSKAQYAGQKRVRHLMIDFWTFKAANIELGLGVLAHDPTHPYLFGMNDTTAQSEFVMLFEKWAPTTPKDPRVFDVPHQCM